MQFIKEKVSIIVPCYNQQAFIAECIESLLAQTYNNWECIIINDGSSDGTETICKDYAEKDNRIRYYFQHNQGVSAARNNGFKKARGEYIHFLDGDDYIDPKKLAVQVEFMNVHVECGVSYTNHKHYLQQKGVTVQYKFKTLSGCPLRELLYEYDNGVSIPIHTALLRRNIWGEEEVPFAKDYSGRYEDWIYWVVIALKGINFQFLNYDFAFYRIHGSNFCVNIMDVKEQSINAMIYIANKLSAPEKENFIKTRRAFFLERFNEQTIAELTSMSLSHDLISKASSFLIKVRNRVGFYRRHINFVKQQKKERLYKCRLKRDLHNTDFTIISNNCWGGGVYEDLNLPYSTPTIGLFFFPSCYLKFVQNLSYNLNMPLEFIEVSKYEKGNLLRGEKPYPIGLIDNEIEIHFLHYYTKAEARDTWNRRKERVNYNNLFFSFTDNEACTIDQIQAFDKIPFRRVFFSSKNIAGIRSLIWLKKFRNNEHIGDIYTNRWDYRGEFNVVRWLNQAV